MDDWQHLGMDGLFISYFLTKRQLYSLQQHMGDALLCTDMYSCGI